MRANISMADAILERLQQQRRRDRLQNFPWKHTGRYGKQLWDRSPSARRQLRLILQPALDPGDRPRQARRDHGIFKRRRCYDQLAGKRHKRHQPRDGSGNGRLPNVQRRIRSLGGLGQMVPSLTKARAATAPFQAPVPVSAGTDTITVQAVLGIQ